MIQNSIYQDQWRAVDAYSIWQGNDDDGILCILHRNHLDVSFRFFLISLYSVHDSQACSSLDNSMQCAATCWNNINRRIDRHVLDHTYRESCGLHQGLKVNWQQVLLVVYKPRTLCNERRQKQNKKWTNFNGFYYTIYVMYLQF